MSWSARRRKNSEIVSPSALAAFKLMTRANLHGTYSAAGAFSGFSRGICAAANMRRRAASCSGVSCAVAATWRPSATKLDDVLGKGRHFHFPHHRLLDERRKLFLLALDPCFLAHIKFGQHFACEKLKRLADMIVPVLTALLDKGDLIDAQILEALEMCSELRGRADPARSAGLGERGSCLFISRPDIGTARLVLAENIVVCQRIAEELESVLAAVLCFLGVEMQKPVTMAILALTAWPIGTHSVLMMR